MCEVCADVHVSDSTKHRSEEKGTNRLVLNGTPMTELAYSRQLPYEITQCYLLPDTSERPRLNLSPRVSTRFTYPRGMGG